MFRCRTIIYISTNVYNKFQAMVQCVSSSEPDMAESERPWPTRDISSDSDSQSEFYFFLDLRCIAHSRIGRGVVGYRGKASSALPEQRN